MVTVILNVQLLASLTVTVCVPAGNVLNVAEAPKAPPFKLYIYPGVPPVAETVTLPVDPPKQLTLVCAVMLAEGPPGTVAVTVTEAEHPFASVIV